MAYVQIEADEVSADSLLSQSRSDFGPQRIEEGPERLQFHCARRFLPYHWSELMLPQLTWNLATIQTRREEEGAQVWMFKCFYMAHLGTNFV